MYAASTKYSERSPRIAKMFDVKMMNGSRVTAKMAGMESTANITSLLSTSNSASNRGVAISLPSTRTMKWRPW